MGFEYSEFDDAGDERASVDKISREGEWQQSVILNMLTSDGQGIVRSNSLGDKGEGAFLPVLLLEDSGTPAPPSGSDTRARGRVGDIEERSRRAPEIMEAQNGIVRDGRFLPIRIVEGVTVRFANEVIESYLAIPEYLRREFQRAGQRVLLTPHLTHPDAFSDLSVRSPMGWEIGSTWDNVEGIYRISTGIVGIAERFRSRRDNAWLNNTRIGGVMRHEFAHALDSVWGASGTVFSSSPEFIAAFDRDRAHMSPALSSMPHFRYYVQHGRPAAGRSEAFADVMATILGGPAVEARRDILRRNFPEVFSLIEARMAQSASRSQK